MSTSAARFCASTAVKIVAATTAGMKSRKENAKEDCLLTFLSKPVVMVTPLLETPGIRAMP